MRLHESLRHPFLLAEGSVVERLRRMPGIVLDPILEHAALIYDHRGAQALEAIYREYLEIAGSSQLPMLCFSPTWRASAVRLGGAGYSHRDVNGDGVRFLAGIRAGSTNRKTVCIGGLAGCAGDAYRPEESLDADRAADYHRPQLEALAAAGPDFLFASTLPAAPEALGLARAMSGTGLPYLLSFIVRRDGNLLDGTRLDHVIDVIDNGVSAAPDGYMLNCVHPTVCQSALARLPARSLTRVIGFQANTSAREPRELDGLQHLETEAPEILAQSVWILRKRYDLRVLGGCCGTDGRHIRAIAALAALSFPQP